MSIGSASDYSIPPRAWPLIVTEQEPSTIPKISVDTIRGPGYPPPYRVRRPRIRKSFEKKLPERIVGDTIKVISINKIRVNEIAVIREPFPGPHELISFLRENPIIPFIRPIRRPKEPFEEALYHWAMRKAKGTTQQSTSE